MTVPSKNAGRAQVAIQAKTYDGINSNDGVLGSYERRTVIQPCNSPQKAGLSIPGGAYNLVQRY